MADRSAGVVRAARANGRRTARCGLTVGAQPAVLDRRFARAASVALDRNRASRPCNTPRVRGSHSRRGSKGREGARLGLGRG